MNISGYRLERELTTNKAGFCQWGFATKLDHKFFIKKFLDNKYPDASKCSGTLYEKKKKKFEDFFSRKKNLYNVLARCRSGNIMIVTDFFRNDKFLFAVTDKISEKTVALEKVPRLSFSAKYLLTSTILYNFFILHTNGIIHSDVKPDNILIAESKTPGYCVPKIIDFDLSFLSGDVPEDLGGDQVYFSPEALLYLKGERKTVDEKIDIFALGILFHELWCGQRPECSGGYHFVHEAILNDSPVILNERIPEKIRNLIQSMLKKDPGERISALDAFLFLRNSETDIIPSLCRESAPIDESFFTVPEESYTEKKEKKRATTTATKGRLKVRMKTRSTSEETACKETVTYKEPDRAFRKPADF